MEGYGRGRFVTAALMLVLMTTSLWTGSVVDAQNCGNIGASLAPCLGFLNGGPQPAYNSGCCSSVRSLDRSAQTSRAVRQNICRCLQSAAAILKPSPSAVNKLAAVCGARNRFSLNQNCNSLP
ncbi:hypothetical protein KP509_11G012100 [Ceratopteris richardii]|uniref:Bifunctional inhibitor/plant lipid transfer protein/seed storage helical domain-containing protein n=1 Tax=Ceratopteris richardii TaxID=49495 RepID=A0A8T2TVH3_CERRI|nr:hypothetical protein KP509_11G012100 [Ceratopteris richardii]